MDTQDFQPAALDESMIMKLKTFEESISDEAGSKIVVIAYQSKDESADRKTNE
ncbi:hypothetical protein [Paenibacillus marinisediminis]